MEIFLPKFGLVPVIIESLGHGHTRVVPITGERYDEILNTHKIIAQTSTERGSLITFRENELPGV
jgi:hypothetical protein